MTETMQKISNMQVPNEMALPAEPNSGISTGVPSANDEPVFTNMDMSLDTYDFLEVPSVIPENAYPKSRPLWKPSEFTGINKYSLPKPNFPESTMSNRAWKKEEYALTDKDLTYGFLDLENKKSETQIIEESFKKGVKKQKDRKADESYWEPSKFSKDYAAKIERNSELVDKWQNGTVRYEKPKPSLRHNPKSKNLIQRAWSLAFG